MHQRNICGIYLACTLWDSVRRTIFMIHDMLPSRESVSSTSFRKPSENIHPSFRFCPLPSISYTFFCYNFVTHPKPYIWFQDMQSTKRSFLKAGEQSSIQALLEFFRLQCRFESFRGSKGGFSHFLGLTASLTKIKDNNNDSPSYNNVREEDFSFEETNIPPYKPALVYRYHLRESLQQLNVDQCGDTRIRLSTYTSILDDVSTWSMILGTLTNPRPGVSVTMQTEWGPGARSSPSLSDPLNTRAVDIVTTLTKKGQTMGFLRTEVRHPVTSEVICHCQHTKFLNPGWMFRIIFTPQGRWFLDKIAKYIFPLLVRSNSNRVQNNNTTAKQILESFEMIGENKATFRVGPQHTNGFGGLHGGVQAILMENLGRRVAKKHLAMAMVKISKEVSDSPHDLICERILVSYQSSASKQLKLQAFVIDLQPREQSISLRIVIERDNNSSSSQSVLVSEGILSFAFKAV
jgi:hypothetical protein